MAFHLTHRYGDMTPGGEDTDFLALLQELDDRPEDSEHGSLAVTHESEWNMSVSRGGYVVFENLETGGARHLNGVSTGKVVELWRRLANGDLIALADEAWIDGY